MPTCKRVYTILYQQLSTKMTDLKQKVKDFAEVHIKPQIYNH